jgi:hypothetical protein
MTNKAAANVTSAGHEAMRTGTQPPGQDSSGMPGDRAALPAGALSKPYFGPQGDENRPPPDNAPVPPQPGATIPADRTSPRGRPPR